MILVVSPPPVTEETGAMCRIPPGYREIAFKKKRKINCYDFEVFLSNALAGFDLTTINTGVEDTRPGRYEVIIAFIFQKTTN
jgi:hypothetical protein